VNTFPELTDQLRDRAQRAAQDWHTGATVTKVAPLTGGSSSLTFIADLENVPAEQERLVLKVAPPGLPPVRNRDVLRQGRLMRALYGQPGVLVPPVFFEDAGDPPDVSPFLAMGFIPGECVEPTLSPERDPAKNGQVRERGLDAARMLAAVHSLDPAAIGLGDEPVVPIAAEIDRWTRAFTTVSTELQGDYERCAAALHATIPEPMAPVINHGDYRLGNTLCLGDSITAIIDWEIWSVGDPRIDITWLTFFTDETQHPGSRSPEPTGMPTNQELIDTYVAAGGPPLPDLRWFEALTRYKETSATALLIKRAMKAGDLGPMANMVPALPLMLEETLSLIA
jgi:aminoglycoside phosphotransferase (APT) family kinase protein